MGVSIVIHSCKKNPGEECPKCPRVTSVIPHASHYYDTVLVIGQNLLPNPNYNDTLQVKFNGKQIPEEYILKNSDDSIQLIIPKGTEAGPVTVDINVADGLVSAGSANFTYLYYATVSTYAGSGVPGNTNNTDPLLAEFNQPDLIALNPVNGNLYVRDRLGTTGAFNIRQIDPAGVVSTITTTMLEMEAIACNNNGVIFVAGGNGGNCEIYTLSIATQIFSQYAGQESDCQHKDGRVDTARFNNPIAAMTFDRYNNMYVLDGCYLRFINTQAGIVSTITGSPNPGYMNGSVDSASFAYPSSLAVKDDGTVFISDKNNHAIRKIISGIVSTVAGVGSPGFSNGTATSSFMNAPKFICTDFDGNIFVLEGGKHCLRKIDLGNNTIGVFAGNETIYAYAEGLPLDSRFNNPSQLAFVRAKKILYITDTNNNRVRKILFE